MANADVDDELRYPIGRFHTPEAWSPADVSEWIGQIADLPATLRETVQSFSQEQLETPYRPGGWTVRQVVHHLPDSHLNSFIRFKWALTEDCPVIKPYLEQQWAELADTRETPIEVSLELLEALHGRWVVLLRSLTPSQLKREFQHPESGTESLGATIGAYAWHGRHHLAHIQRLAARNGWS